MRIIVSCILLLLPILALAQEEGNEPMLFLKKQKGEKIHYVEDGDRIIYKVMIKGDTVWRKASRIKFTESTIWINGEEFQPNQFSRIVVRSKNYKKTRLPSIVDSGVGLIGMYSAYWLMFKYSKELNEAGQAHSVGYGAVFFLTTATIATLGILPLMKLIISYKKYNLEKDWILVIGRE